MKQDIGEIFITVNFDLIVQQIKATGENNNIYSDCDKYVTYSGKNVSGTVITLIQNHNYLFVMDAAKDNKSEAVFFNQFFDDDLVIKHNPIEPLTVSCFAKQLNKVGKDVSMQVEFLDRNKNSCIARWDPKILVDTDPGLILAHSL